MAKIRKFRPEPYSQGPHAHAVHDAGGKLFDLPVNRAKFDARLKAYAPGCGSDVRIPGTNGGFARCGGALGDGQTKVFCAHCEPRDVAESVVDRLLETEAFVRVCAACEKEFGLLPTEPGQTKTHSLCRRHALEQFGSMLSAEEIASMDWVPDRASAQSSPADQAITRAS